MERYWPWCQISQSISPNQFILLYFFFNQTHGQASIVASLTELKKFGAECEANGGGPGPEQGGRARNVGTSLLFSLSLSLSLLFIHSISPHSLDDRECRWMSDREEEGRRYSSTSFFIFYFILFSSICRGFFLLLLLLLLFFSFLFSFFPPCENDRRGPSSQLNTTRRRRSRRRRRRRRRRRNENERKDEKKKKSYSKRRRGGDDDHRVDNGPIPIDTFSCTQLFFFIFGLFFFVAGGGGGPIFSTFLPIIVMIININGEPIHWRWATPKSKPTNKEAALFPDPYLYLISFSGGPEINTNPTGWFNKKKPQNRKRRSAKECLRFLSASILKIEKKKSKYFALFFCFFGVKFVFSCHFRVHGGRSFHFPPQNRRGKRKNKEKKRKRRNRNEEYHKKKIRTGVRKYCQWNVDYAHCFFPLFSPL